MEIIPKSERKSIDELKLMQDSFIVLPVSTIHEHMYSQMKFDHDSPVKPFMVTVKEGNEKKKKIGLFREGKILMKPTFDIVLGISVNKYMPYSHNNYNIIVLGKIKSFNPETEKVSYSFYAFNLSGYIFAGPFDDFTLSTERHFITIKKDNSYAVINCYGYTIIPFGKYSWIDGFHGGYVRARQGHITNGQRENDANWSLIDYHGEVVYKDCYNIWNFYGQDDSYIKIQEKKDGDIENKIKLIKRFDYKDITSPRKPDRNPDYFDYNKAAREQISDAYEGDPDMRWNTD